MITAPGSVPYNATYMVSVKIVDQWNNPIYGESVDLTATGGTVNAPNPTTTNKTGEASWSVTAPDTSSSSTEVLMVEIVSTGAVLNTSIKYTTKRKRPSMEEDEEYSNKPPEAAVEPKNTELYLTDEK